MIENRTGMNLKRSRFSILPGKNYFQAIMEYQEYPAAPDLAPWVICHFCFSIPPADPPVPIDHTILPDGGVGLVFHTNSLNPELEWVRVTGPRTLNLRTPIFSGSTYVGSRFRPGVAGSLMGADSAALRNTIVEAATVFPSFDFQAIRRALLAGQSPFALLDRAIAAIIPPRTQPDEQVAAAVEAILTSRGTIRIGELIKQIPLSERQLQKRFRYQVGLSMKELARICRLRHTIIDIVVREKDQFEALYGAGYFDQAHFINEFSSVSGMAPSLFYHYIRQIHSDLIDSLS